jgi:hypothetical protein
VKFELGAYSFGVAGKNSGGETVTTAQAVRNMLEQIRLAEQAGLDFYGVGEHHTATMPVSSPAAVINAAAAVTSTITLSTAVSVLSTDDPHHRPAPPPGPHAPLPPDGHRRHAARRGTQVHRATRNRGRPRVRAQLNGTALSWEAEDAVADDVALDL